MTPPEGLPNNHICVVCEKPLTDDQTMCCSAECIKSEIHRQRNSHIALPLPEEDAKPDGVISSTTPPPVMEGWSRPIMGPLETMAPHHGRTYLDIMILNDENDWDQGATGDAERYYTLRLGTPIAIANNAESPDAPAESEVARMNAKTLLKCTRCRKTSAVDPDKLVCLQCGEDYSPEKSGGTETPSSSHIKRWDLDRRSCGPDEMRRHDSGRFVRYDDHLSELAARDALIGEEVKKIRELLDQPYRGAVFTSVLSGCLDRLSALRRADGKEGRS